MVTAVGTESIGLALVCFGISAYLCITAMFLLTRAPRWAAGEIIDWFVISTFSITTSGVVLLVGQGAFGGDGREFLMYRPGGYERGVYIRNHRPGLDRLCGEILGNSDGIKS